jgi:N-acyl homoserine lactone hydrolase
MARLTILETGIWNIPRNEIIAAETPEIYAENRRHKIPGYSVLIKDKKIGNVLWDTGIASDWETTWPKEFKANYTFDKLCRLDEELAKVGLAVDDIDLLVLSHLHYDHAGNVKLFKNTSAGQKILISEAEAQEAFPKVAMSSNGVSGAYFRDEIIMEGIGYQTIEEDMWVSDDVFLFIQRGHTPGVIGLLVKTEKNGYMIFASDAVYSKLNFGPPIVLPGLCVDADAYKENVIRLQQMKREYNAKMVFGHDLEDYEQWESAPYWYE